MNSITTRTKRTLSGLFAALFALSLVAVPSAALAAAPFFGADSTNTSQDIFIGEGLTALTAFDDVGDPLAFSLNSGSLPDGITLNEDGTFSGVTTTAGTFSPLIYVSTPSGGYATTTLIVTVSAPNQAPFFGPEATNTHQDITVGDGLTALTAFDPDGDPLTFIIWGTLPDGITLNADGTFSGVATTLGYTIGTIGVSDPFADWVLGSSAFTVEVTVSDSSASPTPEPSPSASPTPAPSDSPNQPPVFANSLVSIFVGEGLTAITPIDPDGDVLTFTFAAGRLPDGITLNADGTFSGAATTAGDFYSQIQGCDPFGACAIQNMSVTVFEPSASPSPSASPVVTPSPQAKESTLPLANTSMEGPLGGTPAQLQILVGLLLLSLGAGQLASNRRRRRFLRQR